MPETARSCCADSVSLTRKEHCVKEARHAAASLLDSVVLKLRLGILSVALQFLRLFKIDTVMCVAL